MSDAATGPLESASAEGREILERLARLNAPPGRDGGRPDGDGTEGKLPPHAPEGLPRSWSEHTLRGLLEALPDAVVVVNAAGRIALANARTEELFGYRREELLGQAVEILIPERYRRGHAGLRAGYFAAPAVRPMGTARGELYGRHKGGGEFPVEISLSPLESEHGLLVTAVIRDVTRRKREEAKFRTLVENIPAVTFIAPLDESVPEFYVSPQIEQLLGFSQKEWLEDPVLWHRQLHPDDRPRWNRQFAPTVSQGTAFREVYRFVAKDGRVVWVHGSAQLVRGDDGQPQFLQGVAFDVTSIKEAEEARKRAEENLRLANAELERRVLERTKELERSNAELQEKTEELEQFAYFASHDLREPLRTLVNFPQKLATAYQGRLDPQAEDWLRRTINGAERMRLLIESLSQYSRVVSREPSFAPVDCAAAAQEAARNLQAALEESGAELTVGSLPTVAGSDQRLMLLFQNLIGNAIKFRAPDRTVRVEVRADRHPDGWRFEVRDNGIGIEAKYLERIFRLGERLHSASKYPGTGMGLTICAKIVAGHGGRIWAESRPGEGSSFFFTLPAGAAGTSS
jgi:PAS domain S-box-containing protein